VKQLPAIFLIRPDSENDPFFVQSGSDYIMNSIITKLKELNVISDAILALPSDIPETIVHILKSWDCKLYITDKTLPIERLSDAVSSLHLQQFIVLNSYSHFLSIDALTKASELIYDNHTDFVYTSKTITPSYFAVMNDVALQHLQKAEPLSISPVRIHEYFCKNQGSICMHEVSTLSKRERFLWELEFAGAREMLPVKALEQYYSDESTENWFSRKSQNNLLSTWTRCSDWKWLDAFLETNAKMKLEHIDFSSQFSWYRRWYNHFPIGKTFIEIGFGQSPIISYLLLNSFESGIAIEPKISGNYSQFHKSLELCRQLDSILLHTNKEASQLPSPDDVLGNRIQIQSIILEELSLPDSSIDFIFSRTVLEHINDIESITKEFKRVLKPNGIMLHEIDFSNHNTGIISFDFLKYSREKLNNLTMGINFLRINEYIDIWHTFGFEIEIMLREDTNRIPDFIHKSWELYSKKDLLCHTAVIKAKKI